ncbi:MAG: hypothetical protein ACOX42_09425 [Clostridia bacterium]
MKMDNLWDRVKRGFIRTTNALMDMVEMIIVGIGYALPVAILIGAAYTWCWLRAEKEEKRVKRGEANDG